MCQSFVVLDVEIGVNLFNFAFYSSESNAGEVHNKLAITGSLSQASKKGILYLIDLIEFQSVCVQY